MFVESAAAHADFKYTAINYSNPSAASEEK